ncbi:norsolorinic acid reductase [Lecanosticta acicola]|uniref:Norsolorinic acid reductase n=1 Tax=Lecanosticta acicola TaxID=111012 RepID=A0AAI8YWW5_9PEZI|nr:norsolorinic acid reductase [Lecanosticta acicola]
MALQLQPIEDIQIPGQEGQSLFLEGHDLQIISTPSRESISDFTSLTPALGIATTLYNWCPESLSALLDFKNWFSLTWILNLEAEECKIEIGRIRNLITFGKLNNEGNWTLMLSYTISEKDAEKGAWKANTEESMVNGQDIKDPDMINRLARFFVKDLLLNRRWETGKGVRHDFFIEHAPLDPWEDGIRMNPHWLYEGLDLGKCTTCGKDDGKTLSRCGKCGTAAYCSSECQKKDWAVHKGVCAMGLEERGKALHLSKDGGLVRLCQETAETLKKDDGVED